MVLRGLIPINDREHCSVCRRRRPVLEPFTSSNTPPLSIAEVDWTLGEEEPGLASSAAKEAAADLLAVQEGLLAAVFTRIGEVETAEWALDQAKAVGKVQIAAALAAGVPVEQVMAAAGEQWTDLTEPVGGREAAPA